MKKLIALTLIVAFFACTNKPENAFTIEGRLTGDVADSTQVYLRTTDSLRQMVSIDTTMIMSGNFAFEGTEDGPSLYYLFFEGIRGNAPLIIEPGAITFRAQKDSLNFSAIKGTAQNDMFMAYLTDKREMSQMAQSMTTDLRKAQQSNDQVTIEALREEYMELQQKSRDYDVNFIKENPSSLIAVLILEQIIAQKALPLNEIETMVNGLSEEMKQTEIAKKLVEQVASLKGTEVGAIAPTFSGPSPTGQELALNDVKGKVTLVDFWAAWCKPCRAENPNVVAVYNKYKDKGLSIVGVSLDRKKEDWLKAIEDDGLTWNHVSNVKYFQDPIAKLYNVNAIPAAFLIDENGVIIAKNLRGPALEAKVAELLD